MRSFSDLRIYTGLKRARISVSVRFGVNGMHEIPQMSTPREGPFKSVEEGFSLDLQQRLSPATWSATNGPLRARTESVTFTDD